MRITMAGFLLILSCLLLGCQTGKVQSVARGNGSSTTDSPATRSALALSVTDGAGKSALAINGTETKYSVSANGTAVGAIKLKEGKLKLYDTAGKQTGAVKYKDGDYSLRDASDAKIAKFAPKEGGFRLKDTAGNFLLKIKPKDDGLKVSDGSDAVLGKGTINGTTVTLKSEAGAVLYTVSGAADPIASGIMLAKSLSPLQKAALMLAPALLK